MPRKLIILLFCVFATHIGRGQIITTIAGTGGTVFNGDGIAATTANIYHPNAVVVDSMGNIYIAEEGNNRIRKINTSGVISTFAGSGIAGFSGDNGPATLAKLNLPDALAIDILGNIFIADNYNHVIRKVNSLGIITTIAGNNINGYSGDNNMATEAEISNCVGVAVDKLGNLYLSDLNNNRIRKISPDGKIFTIAGTGTIGSSGDGSAATLAELNQPFGLAIDVDNNIYFSDYGNHLIRKINKDGIISTIAGNGTKGCEGIDISATMAQLNYACGLICDANSNVYLADINCNKIKSINKYGFMSDLAGTGGSGYLGDGGLAIHAELKNPSDVFIDKSFNIYISDWANNRIRFIKNTLGVHEINNSSMSFEVFPNPSQGKLIININSAFKEKLKISVNNLLGQVLNEFTITSNSNNEISLDVPDGIYILTANTPTGRVSQKRLISH